MTHSINVNAKAAGLVSDSAILPSMAMQLDGWQTITDSNNYNVIPHIFQRGDRVHLLDGRFLGVVIEVTELRIIFDRAGSDVPDNEFLNYRNIITVLYD